MSTQINVITDRDGLSQKAKLQTQGNRWAKQEADKQKTVKAVAEEKRGANLATKGKDINNDPLYGARRSTQFRAEATSPIRKFLMVSAELLPPTAIISAPARIPLSVDLATVRRWWNIRSRGFKIPPVAFEQVQSSGETYFDNPLLKTDGSRLTLDTSAVPIPPILSLENTTRASAAMTLGGLEWPFKTKKLTLSATVVASTAGQSLTTNSGAVLALSTAGAGVTFSAYGGELLKVNAGSSGGSITGTVTFLGQQIYSSSIEARSTLTVSCEISDSTATINANGTRIVVPADLEILYFIDTSYMYVSASSGASSIRYSLVQPGGARVPWLPVPSLAGSFGNISIEAKG